MNERYARTVQMVGEEGQLRLCEAKVMVVGIGGVGSYAAEAVARAGIGTVAVCDGDEVAASNLNRQLVALHSTIGKNKAEVMAERIKDINPDIRLTVLPVYYKKETESLFRIEEYDWIIDAIDDIDAKVDLIKNAKERGVNIISAMGAAGKFETGFRVADISKTSTCPLARVMRRRLRDEGIEHLPVVFSEEKPVPRNGELGSMSHVPGAMGLTLAGYVINSICR